MNLKMKKVIAWVLVCLCVFGSMPKEMVKAASSSTIYFVPKGQQGRYTDNLDEALQSCSSRGGEIILEKDVHFTYKTGNVVADYIINGEVQAGKINESYELIG